MTSYAVAKWDETFERAESRKLKSLSWISERTDFNSTGWQQGLDEFGPAAWLQIYGAWMVIVRTAATGKKRGHLCGDKGEPWSAVRIARPSGVCPKLIEQTMEWAVKVGWLVPKETLSGDSPDASGDSPDDPPDGRGNSRTTEHDTTGQKTTEQNGTVDDTSDPNRSESSLSKGTHKDQASDRPASVRLSEFVKRSPWLRDLEKRTVNGSSTRWHGSIWSADRLRKDNVSTAPASFWFDWYEGQLSADNPALRCGNQAEAAFILAAVYAVRRIPDEKIKKSRLAVWVSLIKDRECSAITESDFKRAAAEVVRRYGGDLPAVQSSGESRPATNNGISPTVPEHERPRSTLKEKLRRKREAESAVTN